MYQNIKIAILGGGGRTGKYLITQLIEKGYHINVLLRKPETFQIKSPLIKIIEGDALNFTAVTKLINGCQAVISTVGQRPGEPLVAAQATENVLRAVTTFGVKRYLLVAGLNIDTPFDKKGHKTIIATDWMKLNYPVIQEDRQKAYSLLVNSNVNWTLVRVPFIEFSNAKGNVAADLNDCLGDKINAGNIARFLIEQLFDNSYHNQAPFIYNT